MAVAILVRHAVTAATGDRLGGWTPGVHLSEAGGEQAAAAAERLAHVPVAGIYSSPLERTRETAEALAGPHDLEVRIRDGLGEVDYGEWTDEPLDELRERELWPLIQHTPSRASFPGGETIRAAQARAVDEIEELAAHHGDGVFVGVSHADVIKAVLAHYAGMALDAFQRLVVSPASINVMALPDAGRPAILRLNDTGPIDLPEPS